MKETQLGELIFDEAKPVGIHDLSETEIAELEATSLDDIVEDLEMMFDREVSDETVANYHNRDMRRMMR